MQLDKSSLVQELQSISSETLLQDFFEKYLGKSGKITQLYKTLATLSPEEKKSQGQFLTDLKQSIDVLYQQKLTEFNLSKINTQLQNDLTEFWIEYPTLPQGHFNLITKARRQLEEIFHSMGFIIEYGHDVVTKYENFTSVNIPPTHPATEMHDTFFLQQQQESWENLILRTQTSAMQNMLMKKHGAPLKAVIPGKVYRYENTDASHDTVFWQVEGIVIDKNISIAHCKDMLTKTLSALFKTEMSIRLRPAFFPFTEPGFEIDASCPICKWKGCSLCKQTGWIEILGAWMIHPSVLQEGGIDPNIYSGFAFGMGLNRIVSIMNKIKDIRLFTNGDLRFIKSF